MGKCEQERKLTNMEVVHLVKDFTTDHAHIAVNFYIHSNEEWRKKDLFNPLRTLFETTETSSSVVGNFYRLHQCQIEVQDQLTDELQVLIRTPKHQL